MPEGIRGFIPGESGNPKGTTEARAIKPWASGHPVSVAWRKQEAIRLYLEGKNTKQIALILGCSDKTILTYAREPEFRQQVQDLSSELLGQLDEEILTNFRTKSEIVDELAFLALGEMKKLLEDPSTHVGIKAKMIDSALDRCPEISRTKKLDVTSRTLNLKAEDLLAAAQTGVEIENRRALKEAEESAASESHQDLIRE